MNKATRKKAANKFGGPYAMDTITFLVNGDAVSAITSFSGNAVTVYVTRKRAKKK